MGAVEDAALARANADQMAAHGETVTYVPASGATPFDCLMTQAVYELDEATGKIVRDACARSVLHSALAAEGLSMPVVRMERQPGDVVRFANAAGVLEEWDVVGAEYVYGMWDLDLERNLRMEPK